MSVGGTSNHASVNQSFTDLSSLDSIKSLGRDKDPEAILEVAKQFESFFIRELLKEMRKTVDVFASDNPLNSNEMQFHQQMYDQQLSLELSKNSGIGLAEVLASQLSNQYNLDWSEPNKSSVALLELPKINRNSIESVPGYKNSVEFQGAINKPDKDSFENKSDFIQSLMPIARKVAQDLNVPANVLVAQAALETGWGKFINSDNSASSFNLFNIKSDSRWKGDSVQVQTLEYQNGVAHKENASFRVYNSFEHSFTDYIDFIQSNPRYHKALSVTGSPEQYLTELQRAGYATDPNYASKIINILHQTEFGDATDL